MKIKITLVVPVLFTTALFLQILLMPVSIIFKMKVGGFTFSPIYLFLLAIVFLAMIPMIKYLSTLIRRPFFLCMGLASCLILVIGFIKGFDPLSTVSMMLLVSSVCIGFSYSLYFEERFPHMIRILALIVALIGIWLYYYRIPLVDFAYTAGEQSFLKEGGFFRATSLLMNPNSLGYFLVYAIGMTPLAGPKRRWFLALNRISFFAICIFCLLLTESRSALCMFFFVVFIRLLQVIRNKKFSILFLLFVIAFVISGYLYLLAFPAQFNSQDVRVDRWQVALELLGMNGTNTILGVPFGTVLSWNGTPFSDSMPLLLFLQYGLLAGGLWLLLILSGTVRSALISFRRISVSPMVKYHAILVVSMLVPMLLSNFLQLYPASILFGISFGVVFRNCRQRSLPSSGTCLCTQGGLLQ